MAKADNPLKVLADRHTDDYISWLLNSGCQLLKKHPTDLPETERRADAVYEITDEDSNTFILHLEFHQRRTNKGGFALWNLALIGIEGGSPKLVGDTDKEGRNDGIAVV